MTPAWCHSYAYEGEVALVHVDLTNNPQHEIAAHDLLDSEERQRANRFESRDARRNFILCRSALRVNLCSELQCKNRELSFTSVRNERPRAFVRGSEISYGFNVSHTSGHGLLAFTSKGRIGVDIENWNVRHDIDGEIRKVFSPSEQRRLKLEQSNRKLETFLLLWTLKEAFIKAIGEGFRADTTAFTIPDQLLDGEKRAVARFDSLSNAKWELVTYKDNKFVAAFAHELT